MSKTSEEVRTDLPNLTGALPGPRARAIIERDERVVSTSYTRCYPLVVERGEGAVVHDIDGNRFLDFNAGIAVVAAGPCPPPGGGGGQRRAAPVSHQSWTGLYSAGEVTASGALS